MSHTRHARHHQPQAILVLKPSKLLVIFVDILASCRRLQIDACATPMHATPMRVAAYTHIMLCNLWLCAVNNGRLAWYHRRPETFTADEPVCIRDHSLALRRPADCVPLATALLAAEASIARKSTAARCGLKTCPTTRCGWCWRACLLPTCCGPPASAPAGAHFPDPRRFVSGTICLCSSGTRSIWRAR